jgi:serine phosphatase RsbU (regulator of sigma subunit)/pSer/pThr/pTyr-binding forkhead associated (FHA) protein
MAVLVVHNGNSPGQVFPLVKPEMMIGRLQSCDIILEPPGISRTHALIRRKGDTYYVVDQDSRNKTKVNEEVLVPKTDYPLKPGDRINICDVELVFHLQDPTQKDGSGVEILDGPEDSTIHMLDASRSDLQASVVRPEVKLKAILEISRNLSTSLKVEELAPKILESLLGLFVQAERAFIVLLKNNDPEKLAFGQVFHKIRPARRQPLRSSLGAPPADEARLQFARTIIRHVVQQKNSVLYQDAGADQNLPTSASIADLKIRSVMCAPLLTSDGHILGILQLDTADRKQFGQEDLDILEAVARQATIALQNAEMHETLVAQEHMKRDINLAQTIQTSFLPRHVPDVPGFEFFAYYQAALKVGGDYYDFVPLDDDRLVIAVGDVAGKGVAAALMMAKFSGDIRACILTEREPGAATTKANKLLCDAGIEERFITLSIAVLDRRARTLTYASAGHLPIMIRRADGQIDEVGEDVGGCPLGIHDGAVYDQGKVALRPGDVCLMYTDGIPDAESPRAERYDWHGNHRLPRRVAESAGGSAAIARALLQDIREFVANHPQADDMTLVAFGPVPD